MKNWLLKHLPENKFVSNIITLMGGTVGAQLLLLIAAPALTRIYSPDDFGLLGVYLGIVALFGVVVCGRYDLAIPIPEEKDKAINVVKLSLMVCCCTTLIIALLIFVFSKTPVYLRLDSKISQYIWLVPIGVFILGIFNSAYYWRIRNQNFGEIAKSGILQSITTLFIQFSLYGLGTLALLLGNAAGQLSSALFLGKQTIKDCLNSPFVWTDIKNVARAYRHFPFFSTWAALLNTAGRQLPPIMFAALFSSSAAGFYVLAHRVLATPIFVVGIAVANVFFANAAQAHRENKLGELVELVLDRLVHLALPPTVFLIIVAPDLFAFVFGDEWSVAGQYAQWMAPWLCVQFCFLPISTALLAIEKQKLDLLLQGTLFIGRILALVYGYLHHGLLGTVITYSLTSALIYFIYLMIICLSVKLRLAKVSQSMAKALLKSLIICLPLYLVYFASTGVNNVILLFTSLVFASLHYYKMLKSIKK
jgi:O-antigen/teichoic acid export membrane protein